MFLSGSVLPGGFWGSVCVVSPNVFRKQLGILATFAKYGMPFRIKILFHILFFVAALFPLAKGNGVGGPFTRRVVLKFERIDCRRIF